MNEIPKGWEEIPTGPLNLDIPKGWEEVSTPGQNANPFVSDNTQGVDFSQVKEPQQLKETNVLKDYNEANKPYFQQLFDKTIAKSKEYLGLAGTAAEDVANILVPIGEVNLMGKNYDNPITDVKGTETIADKAIKENDLPLQAYNDINKLARTDLTLFANAKDGKTTYNENLANIIIDQFGFDDLGIGEDGKYYATKGDKQVQLNKDSLAEITSSIYGDKMEVTGSILGAKKGYDYGKLLGKKGAFIGAVAGGALGAGTGNMVDMLDSVITNGEKLNLSQVSDEIGKAVVLDAGAGLATAGAIKGIGSVVENNPFGVEKRAAKFIKDLDNLPQSGTPISKEDIAANAQSFGGLKNQDLTQQATFGETQKTLSSMYDNSKEAQATLFADQEALTSNLYNKLGVPEKVNDRFANINEKIAGELTGNINGINQYWKDIYGQTKKDIVDIAGNENIPVNPKVVDEINKSMDGLKTLPNVQGKPVTQEKLTEFQTDYKTMLDSVQIYLKQDVETIVDGIPKTIKQDVDSYTLEGMMDLQRTFNDFFYKYKEKFTEKQYESLKNIKTTMYSDIEHYITTKFDSDPTTGKLIKDKWAEINGDYGTWLKTKGKTKIIDGLTNGNLNAVDISKDLISQSGSVDENALKILGDVAYQLGKTNPEKLNDLYGSIVNNMLNSTMIRKTVNNADVRVVDFEKFNKAYDNMPKQLQNQIFGQTSRGREIQGTLEKFREISKQEAELQKAIIKKGSVLGEADRTSKDKTKDFLFGVGYMIRHRIVGLATKHFSSSEAYHHVVLDMAKQRRYGLAEFDASIQRIESNKTMSFSKEEITNLKNIRKEVAAQKLKSETEEATRVESILNEKNLKIREEELLRFKKEQEDKIKANMLLEHKAIIPPAQIQEGAKEPLGLDIQDRISVANTKRPSTNPVKVNPTSFNEFTDKLGIDKNKIVSKVETEKQFEELKKSPYFDEVVFNGQNTYAKDSKYAYSKDGEKRYIQADYAGQGNDNGYNKIDAAYTPNDKFGTVFTKQDYNNLQKGNITPELVNKIKIEIAEKEQADILAKQDFNKEFTLADEAGAIPFSHPVAGGGVAGAASGTEVDYNQDGKVDEVDIAIGAVIGSIGIKKAMNLFPNYFK